MVTNNPAADTVQRPTNQAMSDWLLAIASKRDRSAFEQLYNHFASRIKSYIIKQGADTATADDLAQEAMVQVWRKAAQYNPTKAVPAAWIFRIARNLQIDRLRRRKFHEVELTAEADRTDEGLSGHERSLEQLDADRLRDLIKSLSSEQMDVIQLAFFL